MLIHVPADVPAFPIPLSNCTSYQISKHFPRPLIGCWWTIILILLTLLPFIIIILSGRHVRLNSFRFIVISCLLLILSWTLRSWLCPICFSESPASGLTVKIYITVLAINWILTIPVQVTLLVTTIAFEDPPMLTLIPGLTRSTSSSTTSPHAVYRLPLLLGRLPIHFLGAYQGQNICILPFASLSHNDNLLPELLLVWEKTSDKQVPEH